MKTNMLTIRQFAELTGHCRATIYALVKSGAIPAYRPFGRKIFIKHEDYLEYLEKSRLQ
jgi:excisionase family DNA binding protein